MHCMKYWSITPIRIAKPRVTLPWEILIGHKIGNLKILGWNHTPQTARRVRNMVVQCQCGLYGQLYAPLVYKKKIIAQCPLCDERDRLRAEAC